jgi:hypothetical protein
MNLSHGQIMRSFIALLEDEKEDKIDVNKNLRNEYRRLSSSFGEKSLEWNNILQSLNDDYAKWDNSEKTKIERLFKNTRSTVLEMENLMNKFRRYEFPMFERKTNYFDLVKFNHYISEITNFSNRPKDIIDFLKTKTQDWFASTGIDKLRKIFFMLAEIFDEYQATCTFLRNYSSSLDSEYYKIIWNDGTSNGSLDPALGFRMVSTRPNSPLDYDDIKTVDAKSMRAYLAKIKFGRKK